MWSHARSILHHDRAVGLDFRYEFLLSQVDIRFGRSHNLLFFNIKRSLRVVTLLNSKCALMLDVVVLGHELTKQDLSMVSDHSPLSVPLFNLASDGVTDFEELFASVLIINRDSIADAESKEGGWRSLDQHHIGLVKVVKRKASATCQCNS